MFEVLGIYNFESAGFGVYPWQALVLNQNSRCGGALVSRQHVVTVGKSVSWIIEFLL